MIVRRRLIRWSVVTVLVIAAAGLAVTRHHWLPPVRRWTVTQGHHAGLVPPAAITGRFLDGRNGSDIIILKHWQAVRAYVGTLPPWPKWMGSGKPPSHFSSTGIVFQPIVAPVGLWMMSTPQRYRWDNISVYMSINLDLYNGTGPGAPMPPLALSVMATASQVNDGSLQILWQPGSLASALREELTTCIHGDISAHDCTLHVVAADGVPVFEVGVGTPAQTFFSTHDGWIVALDFQDVLESPSEEAAQTGVLLRSYFAQPGWHPPASLPPTWWP